MNNIKLRQNLSASGAGSLPSQVKEYRFLRYFGSIQEATERQVQANLKQEYGQVPSSSKIARQTIRSISKGKEPSASEMRFIRQIEEVERKIKRYAEENPKLKRENNELKELNRSTRAQSEFLKSKNQGWENYGKCKEQELKQNIENHNAFRTKMMNIYNESQKISGKRICIGTSS